MLAIPLDFDYFKHTEYPYRIKVDLIVRLELSFSEKLVFCGGDTAATYKLSEISLKYNVIFGNCFATTIGELHAGTTVIPYSIYGNIIPLPDTI